MPRWLAMAVFWLPLLVLFNPFGVFGDLLSSTSEDWFILLLLVPNAFYFAWQFAVGVTLQRYLPKNLQASSLLFRLLLLVILISQLWTFGALAGWPIPAGITSAIDQVLFDFTIIVVPCSLLASLYMLLHCAKVMARAQLERPIKWSEALDHFWWVLLFPIGIWVLQPILNQLLIDYSENDNANPAANPAQPHSSHD